MTLEEFEQFEKIRKQVEARKKKEWEERASKLLNDWIDSWIDEPKDNQQPTNKG